MKYSEIISEEKVRLDPKCWTGKKIGNPKTKVKGGVRVNNCVPKEGVAEGDVVPFERPNGPKENFMFSGVSYFMKDQALPFFQKNNIKIVNVEKFEDEGITEVVIQTTKEKARLLSNRLESMSDDEYGGYFNAQGELMEDFNAEYDDEAGMADNNLETLRRAVDGIDELIQPGDNLPEWCQEKIAVAKSMLVTVWDYMKSEEDRGATAELAEEFDMIERIIEGIAAHNGVDSEVVWTDLESLTEDELYAFAVTSNVVMESQDVAEAARGIPHKVRFSFDDPSGMGRASGHYTVYAPDKEAARRYTLKDMIQKGKRGVQIHAVTPQKTVDEDWSKVNKKDKTDGMSRKAVKAYRREHPGSKLQTAVTTKPSKLKKGSKASKRRKSYCSRSRGQMKMHNISCAKTPDKAICKARRRWNC